jgi:hypothetical protein
VNSYYFSVVHLSVIISATFVTLPNRLGKLPSLAELLASQPKIENSHVTSCFHAASIWINVAGEIAKFFLARLSYSHAPE